MAYGGVARRFQPGGGAATGGGTSAGVTAGSAAADVVCTGSTVRALIGQQQQTGRYGFGVSTGLPGAGVDCLWQQLEHPSIVALAGVGGAGTARMQHQPGGNARVRPQARTRVRRMGRLITQSIGRAVLQSQSHHSAMTSSSGGMSASRSIIVETGPNRAMLSAYRSQTGSITG